MRQIRKKITPLLKRGKNKGYAPSFQKKHILRNPVMGVSLPGTSA